MVLARRHMPKQSFKGLRREQGGHLIAVNCLAFEARRRPTHGEQDTYGGDIPGHLVGV